MKAITILFAVSAICVADAVNAATTYNVTDVAENPTIAISNGNSYAIQTSGNGGGTAVFDEVTGVLQMTLHGEQVSDYSSFYGFAPGGGYTDVITDSFLQLMTSAGGNLSKAGSYMRFDSCTNGPQATINACPNLDGLTLGLSGSDSYYSSQNLALSGGVIKAQITLNGSTVAFDYTLQAVPLPASLWTFGSGLVGLVGFCRRRNSAK